MVYTGTFCTADDITGKAGAGASAISSAEAYLNRYIADAEAEINVATLYNWTDAYANLSADVKGILKQAASNLAAIYVVAYDMSGYDSRTEAENIVNILRDSYLRCLSILRDIKQRDFMQNAD